MMTESKFLPTEDISEDERLAIDKIRRNLPADYHLSDGYILRFLREKKGDLEATEAALAKNILFRKSWGVDELLTKWNYPEILYEYCGGGFVGPDRDGCPTLVSFMGNMDVEGVMKSSTSMDYIKFSMIVMEVALQKCQQHAKKTGRPYERMTLVFNLEGLNSSHYTFKPFGNSFLSLLNIFEEHYPQVTKKIVLIGASSMISYVYTLLGPFLAASTSDKIDIPGEDWLDRVLEYVPPESWPENMGGKMPESELPVDKLSKLRYGVGPVPESYFLTAEEAIERENVTVYAGDKQLVEIPITKAGDRIRYFYQTTGEDIGFAIYHDPLENSDDVKDMVPVFPYIRLECSLLPVQSSVVCEKAGKYVVEFDNSYSWFSSKELTYSIDTEEL